MVRKCITKNLIKTNKLEKKDIFNIKKKVYKLSLMHSCSQT